MPSSSQLIDAIFLANNHPTEQLVFDLSDFALAPAGSQKKKQRWTKRLASGESMFVLFKHPHRPNCPSSGQVRVRFQPENGSHVFTENINKVVDAKCYHTTIVYAGDRTPLQQVS